MARVRVGGIICSSTSCDSAGNTQCSRAMCLKHCLGAPGDCTNPAHKRKKTSAAALTAPSSPAIADAHPSITATPLPIVNANTPSQPIPSSAIHGPSQPYPPQPYPPLPSPPLPSTSALAVPSSTPPVPSSSTFPLPVVPRALPRDRTPNRSQATSRTPVIPRHASHMVPAFDSKFDAEQDRASKKRKRDEEVMEQRLQDSRQLTVHCWLKDGAPPTHDIFQSSGKPPQFIFTKKHVELLGLANALDQPEALEMLRFKVYQPERSYWM